MPRASRPWISDFAARFEEPEPVEVSASYALSAPRKPMPYALVIGVFAFAALGFHWPPAFIVAGWCLFALSLRR